MRKYRMVENEGEMNDWVQVVKGLEHDDKDFGLF